VCSNPHRRFLLLRRYSSLTPYVSHRHYLAVVQQQRHLTRPNKMRNRMSKSIFFRPAPRWLIKTTTTWRLHDIPEHPSAWDPAIPPPFGIFTGTAFPRPIPPVARLLHLTSRSGLHQTLSRPVAPNFLFPFAGLGFSLISLPSFIADTNTNRRQHRSTSQYTRITSGFHPTHLYCPPAFWHNVLYDIATMRSKTPTPVRHQPQLSIHQHAPNACLSTNRFLYPSTTKKTETSLAFWSTVHFPDHRQSSPIRPAPLFGTKPNANSSGRGICLGPLRGENCLLLRDGPE